MKNAVSLETVYTHTHTSNLVKIRKGGNAFICDKKIKKEHTIVQEEY